MRILFMFVAPPPPPTPKPIKSCPLNPLDTLHKHKRTYGRKVRSFISAGSQQHMCVIIRVQFFHTGAHSLIRLVARVIIADLRSGPSVPSTHFHNHRLARCQPATLLIAIDSTPSPPLNFGKITQTYLQHWRICSHASARTHLALLELRAQMRNTSSGHLITYATLLNKIHLIISQPASQPDRQILAPAASAAIENRRSCFSLALGACVRVCECEF